MKILLVEDDDYKANQIKDFLEELDGKVEIRKSFKSGMQSLANNTWDFVLLDMTIPSFEYSTLHTTSRNRKFGGRDILNEMKRKNIVFPTAVVTQYSVFGEEEISLEQLNQELMHDFSEMYKGIVFYNASALDWQDSLLDIIKGENDKNVQDTNC